MVQEKKKLSRKELEDLVIETDSGARRPEHPFPIIVLLGVSFIWSLFQIVVESEIPSLLTVFFNENNIDLNLVLDDTKRRAIHLSFGMFLAFLAYPAFKSSPRRRIPILDWGLALFAAYCAAYQFIYYYDLAARPGLPTDFDIIISVIGIVLLLEATRRSLGFPLLIIASIFLLYTIFGNSTLIPELIRHKGQSFAKIANHQWLTTEGVFGIALNVSSSFVFLFVLFGSLLDKAGAGNYFIKLAFSVLGHLRGGPAKAAVLSSGLTGIISGSSIANTVTTGTFTIPLMKKVGFSGSKAGAVEVSSSVNGQIMPPVMGAAAFLMVEYVNIPYTDVVKHAFIPALISYIALLYMVHLEALKANMQGLEKPVKRTAFQAILMYGIVASSIIILSGLIYYFFTFVRGAVDEASVLGGYLYQFFGLITYIVPHETIVSNAFNITATLIFLAYVALVRIASKYPDLSEDRSNSEIDKLPETLPTVVTGLHYILPIAVLIWCLMIERLSPGLSAFWATLLMILIILTQKPLKALFRNEGNIKARIKESLMNFFDGMVSGARNMIGIAVATAAAGIIVGTVSLTGVGQVLTEVVEVLAGGSVLLMLLYTALICLILGMGLPTTANYIVVASLMAKVVVDLGAQNGLFVPLIAVHLFVFYFGIMADVTPPVGLASFAAAAISGDDPLRTGVQAFAYSLRTAVLPFFFIFNNELILIGTEGFFEGFLVFLYSTAAILILSAGLQGYLLTKNKIIESILLILVAVTIFVPKVWFKILLPDYELADITEFEQKIDDLESSDRIRITVRGIDFDDLNHEFTTFIPGKLKGDNAEEKLYNFGIRISEPVKNRIPVSQVEFNSMAEKTGFDTMNMDNFQITKIEVPLKPHFNPKLLFIPAFIMFVIIYVLQSVRRKKQVALRQ